LRIATLGKFNYRSQHPNHYNWGASRLKGEWKMVSESAGIPIADAKDELMRINKGDA
jgi:hypothetical protein